MTPILVFFILPSNSVDGLFYPGCHAPGHNPNDTALTCHCLSDQGPEIKTTHFAGGRWLTLNGKEEQLLNHGKYVKMTILCQCSLKNGSADRADLYYLNAPWLLVADTVFMLPFQENA
jgi:hypothetical protein